MKFAVVARDPQVDLYLASDFYGLEVVEAEDENEAMSKSHLAELNGLHLHAYEVDDSTELGEHDELLPAKGDL